MLAKYSAGYLIAQETKYHAKCSVFLYIRAKKIKDSQKEDNSLQINEGIALAELITYIEDGADSEIAPIFKLADLIRMYHTRVKQHGTFLSVRVNSTHCK